MKDNSRFLLKGKFTVSAFPLRSDPNLIGMSSTWAVTGESLGSFLWVCGDGRAGLYVHKGPGFGAERGVCMQFQGSKMGEPETEGGLAVLKASECWGR